MVWICTACQAMYHICHRLNEPACGLPPGPANIIEWDTHLNLRHGYDYDDNWKRASYCLTFSGRAACQISWRYFLYPVSRIKISRNRTIFCDKASYSLMNMGLVRHGPRQLTESYCKFAKEYDQVGIRAPWEQYNHKLAFNKGSYVSKKNKQCIIMDNTYWTILNNESR